MTNAKLRLGIHILAQCLVQGAVIAIVPVQLKPYFEALVAVVGVFVAYIDTTAATPQ